MMPETTIVVPCFKVLATLRSCCGVARPVVARSSGGVSDGGVPGYGLAAQSLLKCLRCAWVTACGAAVGAALVAEVHDLGEDVPHAVHARLQLLALRRHHATEHLELLPLW